MHPVSFIAKNKKIINLTQPKQLSQQTGYLMKLLKLKQHKMSTETNYDQMASNQSTFSNT